MPDTTTPSPAAVLAAYLTAWDAAVKTLGAGFHPLTGCRNPRCWHHELPALIKGAVDGMLGRTSGDQT
jgi:hypothetical protein